MLLFGWFLFGAELPHSILSKVLLGEDHFNEDHMNYEDHQIKKISWRLAERCKKDGCEKIVNNKSQLCMEHKKQICGRCKEVRTKFINGFCSGCNLKVRGMY